MPHNQSLHRAAPGAKWIAQKAIHKVHHGGHRCEAQPVKLPYVMPHDAATSRSYVTFVQKKSTFLKSLSRGLAFCVPGRTVTFAVGVLCACTLLANHAVAQAGTELTAGEAEQLARPMAVGAVNDSSKLELAYIIAGNPPERSHLMGDFQWKSFDPTTGKSAAWLFIYYYGPVASTRAWVRVSVESEQVLVKTGLDHEFSTDTGTLPFPMTWTDTDIVLQRTHNADPWITKRVTGKTFMQLYPDASVALIGFGTKIVPRTWRVHYWSESCQVGLNIQFTIDGDEVFGASSSGNLGGCGSQAAEIDKTRFLPISAGDEWQYARRLPDGQLMEADIFRAVGDTTIDDRLFTVLRHDNYDAFGHSSAAGRCAVRVEDSIVRIERLGGTRCIRPQPSCFPYTIYGATDVFSILMGGEAVIGDLRYPVAAIGADAGGSIHGGESYSQWNYYGADVGPFRCEQRRNDRLTELYVLEYARVGDKSFGAQVVGRVEHNLSAPNDSNEGHLVTYPNPFSSNLTIELGNLDNRASALILFDATGRQVGFQAVPLGSSGPITYSHPLPASGVYFLCLRVSDERSNCKKVVKR